MSQIEFGRYDIVAVARGQKPLLYQEYGSYQGEWLLFAKDDEQFYLYKDWYGSCSGCDSLEAANISSPCDIEKALEFVKDYRSFIEVPLATALNLTRAGNFEKVMPANIKDDYSRDEMDVPSFARDCQVAIKLECAEELNVDDIIGARNQELKQRALRKFGYERFVSEAHMEEVDVDGENKLLKNGEIVFAYVKDSSTPRRYLLRVPPTMKRVREAIAWTFDLSESQYKPLVET